MHSEEHIKERACHLTHKLQALFEGEPTASVYLAISYALGEMEMSGKNADRDGTFRILGLGMDEFIQFNTRHQR